MAKVPGIAEQWDFVKYCRENLLIFIGRLSHQATRTKLHRVFARELKIKKGPEELCSFELILISPLTRRGRISGELTVQSNHES
jgi:hypothetical protein